MYKIFILVAFCLVLVVDFFSELFQKKISIFDAILRALMIVAFCYLCEWF